MTDAQRFEKARASGEIITHSVDFYCRRCGRNFDFIKTPKLGPAAFVLAHMKSCALAVRR